LIGAGVVEISAGGSADIQEAIGGGISARIDHLATLTSWATIDSTVTIDLAWRSAVLDQSRTARHIRRAQGFRWNGCDRPRGGSPGGRLC